jgi:heterodisulfide reductase subunit C
VSQVKTLEKMPPRDNAFTARITGEVNNLSRCYQCSMCSDGCPVVYAMDYYPNQLIHLVRMGMKKQALQSNTIWMCLSCETCSTRCPNEIDIVHLMDALRGESLRAGIKSPGSSVIRFHEAFVEQIRKKGRVDETRLMVSYELKTHDFLSLQKIRELTAMGREMLRKGKVRLPSAKRYSPKAIGEIFKRVSSKAGD